MKSVVHTLLLCLIASLLPAQIWDSKNIEFALPSQGWRIRPVDNKTAWTFGFTITEDPFEAWAFTDSEFTCQRTINGGESWEELDFKTLEPGSGFICDVEGLSDKIAYLSYYKLMQLFLPSHPLQQAANNAHVKFLRVNTTKSIVFVQISTKHLQFC